MTTATSWPATLLELLDGHPARSPALVAPDEKVVTTYGSLRAQVQALADGLVSAGVSAGDRVGIVLRNGLPAIRVLDGDGYLTLTGRLKELINRGGERISPHEVDHVLLSHPKILEAVCFGTPHATWGEEVAAAVVVRQPVTEAELQSYCRERLASFKSPKRIFITESIPRTATGKIQRRAVAQAFSSAPR